MIEELSHERGYVVLCHFCSAYFARCFQASRRTLTLGHCQHLHAGRWPRPGVVHATPRALRLSRKVYGAVAAAVKGNVAVDTGRSEREVVPKMARKIVLMRIEA